jgi:acyl transferase domain-containing protein
VEEVVYVVEVLMKVKSIVTGCSLLFSPDLFHLLSNMGMLSPDSKCFSFDNRANGYGRGEGVAALIIKRLPDAIRDGDTIRAVIRSVGTNQDGHTPGVTQPSKTAQTSLIRDTYSKAGLGLQPTRYFEAHGTG